MRKLFSLKISIIIAILFATQISLSMRLANQNRSIVSLSQTQRNNIAMMENQRRNNHKQNIKLLEHSCFKGESIPISGSILFFAFYSSTSTTTSNKSSRSGR